LFSRNITLMIKFKECRYAQAVILFSSKIKWPNVNV